MSEKLWIAKNSKYPELRATSRAPLVSLLLGRHLWTIENDSVRCSPNQSYTVELILTGCYDSEFNCNDGGCVLMEQRCDGKADCKDSSDESKCDILDHGIGYDKHIVPVDTETGRLEVSLSVEILNVLDIREVSEEVTIKLVLVREFYDNRLTYSNLKEDEDLNKLSHEEVDSLWFPEMLF